MAKILFGAPVKEEIKNRLISRLQKINHKPVLAIVQVGDRSDSNTYIRNKIKFGNEIGVSVILKKFPEEITEDNLFREVKMLGGDRSVDGIIVQLPLPGNIDSNRIINVIPKNKDADGLSAVSELGDTLVTPATAKAVLSILNFYNIEIKNKKVAVIGKSRLAGGPISELLKSLGGEVEACDRSTENIKEVCRNSDILISAAGQTNLVDKSFVKSGQVVIDVGINKTTSPLAPLLAKDRGEEEKDIIPKPKITGDVNFEEVEPIVDSITPVPGGVGPLTVACLFENLLDLVENKI